MFVMKWRRRPLEYCSSHCRKKFRGEFHKVLWKMDEGCEIKKKRPSIWSSIYTTLMFLLTDVIIYGLLVPIIGAYIGGGLAHRFDLSPKWEVVTIVFFTFSLIYMTFCVVGEPSYWKHLFAFESFYSDLLKGRDFVNAIMLLQCLSGLGAMIEIMVNNDKGMKDRCLSEGIIYEAAKIALESLNVDAVPILESFGFKAPHKGTFTDPNYGENEKFEHGAVYILQWAIFTGCVAKIVYYNTLFTYLKSMKIFMSMKPVFHDDDDIDDTYYYGKNAPSRLENDVAYSARKRN